MPMMDANWKTSVELLHNLESKRDEWNGRVHMISALVTADGEFTCRMYCHGLTDGGRYTAQFFSVPQCIGL